MIADGAAFGSEIERVISLTEKHLMYLYLPESFEWLILSSGAVNDSDIKNILKDTSDYVESSEYLSWERFFTALLTERTHNTYLQYSKSTLNDSYTIGKVFENIVNEMKNISFGKGADE